MTLEKTRDAARGRWRGILTHFGIDETFLRDLHGPCPICKGRDRFRWDDDEGSGSFYCNNCGAGSGLRLLELFKGWSFPQAAAEVDKILGNIARQDVKAKAQAEDKVSIMRAMYQGSSIVTPGDPVWRYLERRCGDLTGLVGSLRYHPGLRHSVDGGTHPAMLALMWPHGSPKAIGIHRTYLTRDGHKASVDPVRMTFGEVAAVQLGPVAERMGIAEGIETALCAGKHFGIPVWAAISANGMKAWRPPEGVKTVVICGDNDHSLTGQEAAFALGRRLVAEGIQVEVEIPPTPGTDWADVQMGQVA